MMSLFRLHDLLSESLAHPERISGLVLLGFVVIAAMVLGTWLRRQARKTWGTDTFSAAAADDLVAPENKQSNELPRKRYPSPYQPKTWGPALRLAGLLLIGIAAADPRLGRGTSEARRSSEQIVLLLDRSRSMLAADAEPTRFALARHVAADVIDHAQGAAIAIVSFAGDARIDSPLSRDPSPLREQLEALEPEQDARSGTELARGLMLAMDSFASRFVGPKRLIVLTDGETHEPVSLAGVRILEDVDVLFLGIGDSINGARIPLKPGENEYLTYKGRTVWTKSQPKNLEDLAHRLNGQSQMITSAAEGGRIVSAARGDIQKSLRWERLATATSFYSPLLYAALALLVMELFLPSSDSLGTDTFSAAASHNSVTLANQQANGPPRKRCLSPYQPKTGTTITSALLAILVLFLVSGASPTSENTPYSQREIAETYNLGVEAYQRAGWPEAEAQFRLAMARGEEPISSQACFNLANTQYQWVRMGGLSKQEAIGRLQESIACYRRCIQQNQRPADARANLQIVYAFLKQIENQRPNRGQSGSNDKDQGSASPPSSSNNRQAEHAQGNNPPQSGGKSTPNSSPGDASKPDKQTAMSPPPDATEGQAQEELTDRAAEDELRRIRDQARRRGPGKRDVLAGPTVPGGLPW